MSLRSESDRSFLSVILGAVTLVAVALLLGWDVFPLMFPAGSHAVLAAFSLALIALAYLVCQVARRPAPAELFKTILLAIAFLFWAANQFWADSPLATLFNDIAIALFILDVFLVIVGWPRASKDSSFAEVRSRRCCDCCASSCRDGCCTAGPVSAG